MIFVHSHSQPYRIWKNTLKSKFTFCDYYYSYTFPSFPINNADIFLKKWLAEFRAWCTYIGISYFHTIKTPFLEEGKIEHKMNKSQKSLFWGMFNITKRGSALDEFGKHFTFCGIIIWYLHIYTRKIAPSIMYFNKAKLAVFKATQQDYVMC